MEHWGTQFARSVGHRSEGQSDFALDLIDLLQQKADEFNKEVPKEFKFALKVLPKGEDVEVTNGYKTAAASCGVSSRSDLHSRLEQQHRTRLRGYVAQHSRWL